MSQLKRIRESGSKKSFVKKYYAPSQIITRSLSKKKIKIYSHNDDDVDDDLFAKNMINECVNDDCLAEIFMYVPACERPKISLVCKKWKRVLDNSWFNVKKLELTHWEYDENPHFLKRKYPRINEQFKFLKSLLYKCGRYLKELDLSVYARCNILPVINEYCPNLIKLRIRIGDIDDAILDNAFSHLSKLKVLKIVFHGCFDDEHRIVPTTLINSLLNVADTLTDLNIANWAAALCKKAFFPAEMTSVVIQLKALRKFEVDGIISPQSMCDYLNNSETIRSINDHTCYHEIKMSTTELFERVEKLDILTWGISDDCIYNIANVMKRLHTLRLSCQWLTDTGIAACTKINNLKDLFLAGSNNATDSSIKLLKNLIHLRLPFSNKITDESAIKVLENSPDMIEYCVRKTGITFNFIEKAAEISESRDRGLIVYVSLDYDLYNTQIQYDCLSICFFKKDVQPNKN